MAAALFLMLIAFAAAADRKTIFLGRMNGFERFVEDAIRQQELNIEFITEEEHPDLRILLGKQFTSVAAEIVYQRQTGRKGESILRAIDVKTGKTLVTFRFVMQEEDSARKRAAQSFAVLLRDKLK